MDSLTHVKNKGAFATYIEELQTLMNSGNEMPPFGVGVFDCDDLKQINDQYGHDKGDLYLQAASHAICRTFAKSPVFRIGGDEFSVILRNEDYDNREELVSQLEKDITRVNTTAIYHWDEVHVSMGIAEYDPENDHAVIDVVRRADKIMYEDKRLRKNAESRSPEGDR